MSNHSEDDLFYWQIMLSRAIEKNGRLECPALFGFVSYTLSEEDIKRIRFNPVPRPRERAIYSTRYTITDFSLTFVKQNCGTFCLTLEIPGVAPVVFKTPACALDWTDFALYMEFALTHERVFLADSFKMMIIKATLGIDELVLIN